MKDGHVGNLTSFFKRQNRDQWANPEIWRKICIDVKITEANIKVKNVKRQPDIASTNVTNDQLLDNGYALVGQQFNEDEEANDNNLIQSVAKGITTLHKIYSFPAVFIFLYDEAWTLAKIAANCVTYSTNPANVFNFDMLAWYIDPREGAAGFSPHRDRQPETVASSFHDDGQAKYMTMWMALTDANPENSCLYVIPRPFDPGYIDGDVDDDDNDDTVFSERERNKKESIGVNNGIQITKESKDPLSRALRSKDDYQNIRAIPRRVGESALFTHRIIHWGSRGNPNCHLDTPPRIAISVVCSDPKFEKPYLNLKYTESVKNTDNSSHYLPPPFRIRLLLVCSQLIIYNQRFDLPKECIHACYDYCKEHACDLEETYRKKVFVEFVKAMKKERDTKSKTTFDDGQGTSSVMLGTTNEKDEITHSVNDIIPISRKENEDKDEEEEEEAILKEMLQAETEGYEDFSDDYDDIEDNFGSKIDSLESDTEINDEFECEEDCEGLFFGNKRDNLALKHENTNDHISGQLTKRLKEE